MLQLHETKKLLSNCKNVRKVLRTLLTKRDLNCNDFLPRNGRTHFNYFLGAKKYISFLTNYPDIS